MACGRGASLVPSESTNFQTTSFNTFNRIYDNGHVLVAVELACSVGADIHHGHEHAHLGVAVVHAHFHGSDAHVQVVFQNSFDVRTTVVRNPH
jgi:hypothetical protein